MIWALLGMVLAMGSACQAGGVISDPAGYNKNSYYQKFSAEELIQKQRLDDKSKILDLGCGDGKVSNFLAQKVPNGKVVAIDVDPQVLDFARKSYPRRQIEWTLLDASKLPFLNEFDWVTSFTALHLVENIKEAFNGIFKSLKPGGRVLIQFPLGHGFGRALDEVIRDPIWAPYFSQFVSPWHFFSKEVYQGHLKHFKIIRLEVTTLDEIYASGDAFLNSIQFWLPHLKMIPPKKKAAFLKDFLSRYVAVFPLKEDGKLSYKVERLEIEAQKPE